MPPFDAAIVGAGPIGLEVAAALRREGLACLHLDAGPIGATIAWWAPGTRFFSSPERIAIAGVPLVTAGGEKATREEYLAYLRAVAEQFGLDVRTYEKVEAIEPRRPAATEEQGHEGPTCRPTRGQSRQGLVARPDDDAPARAEDPGPAPPPDGFLLRTRTSAGAHDYAAARVVAAIGDMHRPRLLGIPGEGLPFVSHYLAEPHRYFRRRVLIVGGRNSAVEAAIRLWRAGARVSMSYRREDFDPDRIKYWLLPELRWLIRSGRIDYHPATVPREIRPGRALLAPAAGGPSREVEADDILLLTGYEMDGSLLSAAGVEPLGEQGAPRHDPRTMETNVPGLYVAGTATAGTQRRYRVFIENCHAHAARIAAHVTGRTVPEPAPPAGALEM